MMLLAGFSSVFFFMVILCLIYRPCRSDRYVSELLERLLMDYNKNVRPVKNASDALMVKFGVNLCRLVDVDEVNQVLTTSLWLDMQWRDRKLEWNPNEWGGITKLHIPSDQIWTPDILLYNNADGDPNINVVSLAMVDYNGTVFWQPPSMYKSLCEINIEYFPYDSQECFLKFGGWSNDGQTLDLQQIPPNINDRIERKVDEGGVEFSYLEHGMGLSFFHESAEWDLLNVTSRRYAQIYPGCCGQQYYIDIRYNITIRRKAIFFTVMLTIPCMLIGIFFTVMLTIPCMLIANTTSFVFVVPPREHKMTFSISVFVAFSVFYLVLIEIIPPTSLVLPLIGKYLLFTLLMITVSIIVSVLLINIYRRDWKERMMHLMVNVIQVRCRQPVNFLSLTTDDALEFRTHHETIDIFKRISNKLAIISAKFVNDQLEGMITDEWRLMSLTINRLFLIIYLVLNSVATFMFIWNAQSLYDRRPSLKKTYAHKPLSSSMFTFEALSDF